MDIDTLVDGMRISGFFEETRGYLQVDRHPLDMSEVSTDEDIGDLLKPVAEFFNNTGASSIELGYRQDTEHTPIQLSDVKDVDYGMGPGCYEKVVTYVLREGFMGLTVLDRDNRVILMKDDSYADIFFRDMSPLDYKMLGGERYLNLWAKLERNFGLELGMLDVRARLDDGGLF